MFRLTDQPLDTAALREQAANPHAGAVVLFEGVVRNHHLGREVLRLEYEAHAAVAEKEGARILAEAVERFELDGAVATHRTGPLAVGDLAVVVAVSSAHRAEAFDACRFLIDEIKARVPIWKNEFYADGTSEWVGCEGCAQAGKPHSH